MNEHTCKKCSNVMSLVRPLPPVLLFGYDAVFQCDRCRKIIVERVRENEAKSNEINRN